MNESSINLRERLDHKKYGGSVMLRKNRALIIGSIILAFAVPAYSAPIVGNYSSISYYDLNINDGVTIQQSIAGLSITNGNGANEYNFVDNSGLGVIGGKLIENGYVSSIPVRHFDLGSENLSDYFIMSDGNNMGSVQVRQNNVNPLETSFSVSAWQVDTSPVTIDDMIGEWEFYYDLENLNLRNVSSTFDALSVGVSFNVSRKSEDTVTLNWGADNIDLLVFGNLAYIDSPVISSDGHHHIFGVMFDENGAFLYNVTSELYDATDVSILMGLASKQTIPEPESLLLLFTSLIFIASFRMKILKALQMVNFEANNIKSSES
jgi:hypothetical protein